MEGEASVNETQPQGRFPPLPPIKLEPELLKPVEIPWQDWAKKSDLWGIFGVRGYIATGLDRPRACRLRCGEGVLETGVRFRKPRLLDRKWTLYGYLLFRGGVYDFLHDDRRTLYLDLRELKLVYEDPLLAMPEKIKLSLGRQYLAEDSGLWYRNYLDGLRLDYRRSHRGFYLFAGGRFEDSRVSNSEETVNLKRHFYLVGRLFYQDWLRKGAVELLYEHVDPERKNIYPFYEPAIPRNRLLWLNLEAQKDWPSGWRLWARASKVWGRSERNFFHHPDPCSGNRETSRREGFWAGGLLWEGGLRFTDESKGLGMALTWAEGKDRYVQPRLANNRRRLFGWERLRFFGDLAHPRLENLLVWNVFGGLSLAPVLGGKVWLEFVFLKYLKVDGKELVRFSRCLNSPLRLGKKDLGEELDLILEWRRMDAENNWSLRLVGSYFWPEEAFLRRRPAYKIYFNFRWLVKHMP